MPEESFPPAPQDFIWKWPAAFIDNGLKRLLELQQVEVAWTESVWREFQAAEADPNTWMLTPMVLTSVERHPPHGKRGGCTRGQVSGV
jgi:hypothetical protein